MTLPANPTAARYEKRAAIISVVVSVLLMGIKFVAYYLTGSAAIFSDALESIVNVFASGFASIPLSSRTCRPIGSIRMGTARSSFCRPALKAG